MTDKQAQENLYSYATVHSLLTLELKLSYHKRIPNTSRERSPLRRSRHSRRTTLTKIRRPSNPRTSRTFNQTKTQTVNITNPLDQKPKNLQ